MSTNVKTQFISQRGILIALSGPSGVGKGTIVNLLRERNPEAGLSISATTREPRGQEQDGVEYFFKSKEEFDQMIEEGEILEYDTYVDNKYGTPATPLLKMVQKGQDCFLDITLKGSLAIKQRFGNDAITIFILPPSIEELEKRLTLRGTESIDKIRSRMEMAYKEIQRVNEFDYVVVNDDIQKTVSLIESIITAEHSKTFRNSGIENNYQKMI